MLKLKQPKLKNHEISKFHMSFITLIVSTQDFKIYQRYFSLSYRVGYDITTLDSHKSFVLIIFIT